MAKQEVIGLRPLLVTQLAVLVLLLAGHSLAQTSADQPPDDPFLTRHRELQDKNPEKLLCTLQLKNKQTQFHFGEIIPLELRFASTLPDTYTVENPPYDRSGRVDVDTFVIDRPDDAVDPLNDYYSGHNFGMGGLRTIGALDTTCFLGASTLPSSLLAISLVDRWATIAGH